MSITERLTRGLLALLVAATLLTGVAVSPAAPAALAADTYDPAARDAAGWIAREYGAADSQFEAFLPGVLADIIYALAVPGTDQAVALDAARRLSAGAADYIGAPGALRTGATGKVLLAAIVQRRDPATFVPARNIETELRAAMGSGPDAGKFADDLFNHSLAVLGLAATAGGAPAAAGAWLANKQCPAGDFTFMGTCPGGDDPDTTALAAQALLATRRTAAAERAVDWLADQQNPDGSFSTFGTPNANTTGVAAQALRAGGNVAAADRAAAFIANTLQFDLGAGPERAGGIRYGPGDADPNGFATLQGILAYGAGRYDQLLAPDLSFTDVAPGSTFAEDIAWLAASDITRGCNPPTNDRFCPRDPVRRDQMAAFLVRGLGLVDVDGAAFVDIAGSVFETDINRLATAGITKGCNPPANDRFCPSRSVTRGEMAAFLVRALRLTDTGDRTFVDTVGSTFETDIRKLATAGITRGCNPPSNDRFCPDRPVTREEMAAFLRRGLG